MTAEEKARRAELLGKDNFDYNDCYDVLRILRGEYGCPWDRAQTHKSIVKNVIEEAYELANALEQENVPNTVEETRRPAYAGTVSLGNRRRQRRIPTEGRVYGVVPQAY